MGAILASAAAGLLTVSAISAFLTDDLEGEKERIQRENSASWRSLRVLASQLDAAVEVQADVNMLLAAERLQSFMNEALELSLRETEELDRLIAVAGERLEAVEEAEGFSISQQRGAATNLRKCSRALIQTRELVQSRAAHLSSQLVALSDFIEALESGDACASQLLMTARWSPGYRDLTGQPGECPLCHVDWGAKVSACPECHVSIG